MQRKTDRVGNKGWVVQGMDDIKIETIHLRLIRVSGNEGVGRAPGGLCLTFLPPYV